VKVIVTNTAPESLGGPRVVFTGVGLSAASETGLTRPLQASRITHRMRKQTGAKPEEPPWYQDEEYKRLSQMTYDRIIGQGFPDVTPAESGYGEVLFPSEWAVFESDVLSQEVHLLQFRVEGTVSRRHLAHYQQIIEVPEALVRPPALAAMRAFKGVNIHAPLNSLISSMPDPGKDTRLADIQTLSAALTDKLTEVKELQDAIGKLWREHKMFWFRAHLRATCIYLDRVHAALVRMRDAVSSSIVDKMAVEGSAIRLLKGEADLLDRATEDLLRKYSISDEEVGNTYRNSNSN